MGDSHLVDLSQRYELSPAVAVRPEPFGALCYHYGTRRLNVVRSPKLVTLLGSLGAYESATAAMEAAGVTADERPAVAGALSSLLASDVIRAR